MKQVAILCLAGVALALVSPSARAQVPRSADLERFERQMEQIQRDTRLRVDQRIPAEQRTLFDYGGYLSLNYLSLINSTGSQAAGALRDLLELYATTTDVSARRQIEGVQSVNVRRVVRRLPMRGPIAFGRGLEITVDVDEMAFEGGSAFLLGAVLERYFARYVSVNSVTETVLRSQNRGEINRWTPNWGTRPTL
jgi:type VI secretion system protein ImpG